MGVVEDADAATHAEVCGNVLRQEQVPQSELACTDLQLREDTRLAVTVRTQAQCRQLGSMARLGGEDVLLDEGAHAVEERLPSSGRAQIHVATSGERSAGTMRGSTRDSLTLAVDTDGRCWRWKQYRRWGALPLARP